MSVCCGYRKIEIRTVRKIPSNLCCSVFGLTFFCSNGILTKASLPLLFIVASRSLKEIFQVGSGSTSIKKQKNHLFLKTSSLLTKRSLVSPPQGRSSSTPAWPCWVSSLSTAACRRPRPGVWRRSRPSLKTNSAPAAPQIQTRGGRWNTSESKVPTTTYRTTTHPMWTRDGFDPLSSWVGFFWVFILNVWAKVALISFVRVTNISDLTFQIQESEKLHYQ